MDQGAFILALINGAKAESGAPADAAYLAQKAQIGLYYGGQLGLTDPGAAQEVMAFHDGTAAGQSAAYGAADAALAAATTAGDGSFTMPLVGILDSVFDTV